MMHHDALQQQINQKLHSVKSGGSEAAKRHSNSTFNDLGKLTNNREKFSKRMKVPGKCFMRLEIQNDKLKLFGIIRESDDECTMSRKKKASLICDSSAIHVRS
jgi:hypothetical protein